MSDHEVVAFIDEAESVVRTPQLPPWRILIVDDDSDVHDVTVFSLKDLTIKGRPLEFLHAATAAEAQSLLKSEDNIAVLLLDVVMETVTAGLDLVAIIRRDMGLSNLRIILRTGQPGHAPDVETVRQYDINDYHTKSELTRSRLYVALSTAIATYEQLENIAKLTERLRNQAYFDPLLKLPNRNGFIEAINAQLNLNSGQGYVTALLDIDQFAEINDMFGHAYGDQLLQAIARRLESKLGSFTKIARVGADTFGLLGHMQDLPPELLQSIFSLPFMVDNIEHVVTVAIGLVRMDSTSIATDLLKDASIALKGAKLRGHGQIAWYTPEVGNETRERTRMLQALREGFSHDRLFVVYQPQLSLSTGKIIGFEALIRWRAEDGSAIPPDKFIPASEKSGLIVSIGDWVLRTALRAANELRREGLENFHMAVNVSVVQFRQPDFIAALDTALRVTGANPQDLELEITESVAMIGAEYVEEIFSALKARGIKLAIDDFGTGFSSLSYLERLPADRIKIDRTFVNALELGERGARIAELIVPLGRQLGMKVLAEGIENKQQLSQLRALGCDEGQGYLFSKALPLPELQHWVKQWVDRGTQSWQK